MKLLLFVVIAFFYLVPGILLLIGAIRFRRKVHQLSSLLILVGGCLLFIALLRPIGTYYYASIGAESLASYTLKTSMFFQIAQYLGLIVIAISLLLFKK